MDIIMRAIQQIISESVALQTEPTDPLYGIKNIYYGDPVQIEDVLLPSIIIHPKDSTYETRGSKYDNKTRIVEVRVVINRKDFYADNGGKYNDNTTVNAVKDMVKRFELEDVPLEERQKTICGLIQKNLNLPYTGRDGEKRNIADIAKVTNVSYVFRTERGFPTYEGIATIEVLKVADR